MRIVRSLAAVFLSLLAAVPAWADPAIWVAHKGTATVYLFGTIHVLPAGTQWMDRAVLMALGASQEIWTEADISSLSSSINAIRHYGLHADRPTVDLLPEAYRARYREQVAQSGMPAALFDQAQPWLVEILLSAVAMQHYGSMGLGVEASLMRYAADHHLATPTFETLDTQFAMLADLPLDAQLASLEEQIDEFDLAGTQFAELLSAWRAGDDATLDRLTNQDMRKHNVIMWTELILRRNEHFTQKIEERLDGSGTFFVAIGAAHLCGSTGIPALLRTHGIKVDRLR
jgi:uncharacterized protein YbaP (TraB family)